MLRHLCVSAAIGLGLSQPSDAQVEFHRLGLLPGGDPPSTAWDVSANGSVIVGWARGDRGRQAFRWTKQTGMVGLLAPAESQALGISLDGTVTVGWSGGLTRSEPVQWTSSGVMFLDGVPGGDSVAVATATSGDGSVIVGWDEDHGAFRWTKDGGFSYLGTSPKVHDVVISGDGSVIAGSHNSGSQSRPFLWTEQDGVQPLPALQVSHDAWVRDLSADGRVAVGRSGSHAVMWVDGAVHELVGFAGNSGFQEAHGVSGNGSIIVGERLHPTLGGPEAWIWTEEIGILGLQDYLLMEHGLDLPGWRLSRAMAVSADGTTIVGIGVSPNGVGEAWAVTIPAPGAASLMLATALTTSRRRRAAANGNP